jgi:DNA-binding Xre family transcriptional regulator
MSLLRTALGTVLRRLRRRQGRTLQDVADAARISMPYLSEIERGRKEASSEILAGICRALGVALPDLLEEVRLELLRANPAVIPPRCAARVSAAPVRPARPGRARPSSAWPGSLGGSLSPVGEGAGERRRGGCCRGPRTRRLVSCRPIMVAA